MDIQNRIRDILSDTIQQDFMGQSGKVGEEELLHKLKQQGLVDDILHQLQFRGQQGGTTPATHFLDRDDKVTQLPTKKGMVKVEFSLFRYMVENKHHSFVFPKCRWLHKNSSFKNFILVIKNKVSKDQANIFLVLSFLLKRTSVNLFNNIIMSMKRLHEV